MTTPLTESEVRALRDRVFDGPVSDAEWATCKHWWMHPSEVAWLKAHDWPCHEALTRREAGAP